MKKKVKAPEPPPSAFTPEQLAELKQLIRDEVLANLTVTADNDTTYDGHPVIDVSVGWN